MPRGCIGYGGLGAGSRKVTERTRAFFELLQSVEVLVGAGKSDRYPNDVNTVFIRVISRCMDPMFRNLLIEKLGTLAKDKACDNDPWSTADVDSDNRPDNMYGYRGGDNEFTGASTQDTMTERSVEDLDQMVNTWSQDLPPTDWQCWAQKFPAHAHNNSPTTLTDSGLFDPYPKSQEPESVTVSGSSDPLHWSSHPRVFAMHQEIDRLDRMISGYQLPATSSADANDSAEMITTSSPVPPVEEENAVPYSKALTNNEADTSSPGFAEERIYKIRILYLCLYLLSWRHISSTVGTESITSSRSSVGEPGMCQDSSQNDLGTIENTDEASDGGDGAPAVTSTQANDSGLIESSGAATQKSHPKATLKRKQNCSADDDDSDTPDGPHPPPKRAKVDDMRSLRKRFACPFAKAEPIVYHECLMVTRKDLTGVKEHLKRKHFRGQIPSEIRASKTWGEVFGCCYPQHELPYPHGYYDVPHLYASLVARLPVIPPPPLQQGNGHAGLDSPFPQNATSLESHDSLPGGVGSSPTSHNQPDGSIGEQVYRSPPFDQPNLQIPENPLASLVDGQPQNLVTQPETNEHRTPMGVSEMININSTIEAMLWPHLSWPLAASDQEELKQSSDYFSVEFGVDLASMSEEDYLTVSGAMRQDNEPSSAEDVNSVSQACSQQVETQVKTSKAPDQDVPQGLGAVLFNSPSSRSNNLPSTSSSSQNDIPAVPSVVNPEHQVSQEPPSNIGLPPRKKYAVLILKESHACKRFPFQDFGEFSTSFEVWLSNTFLDPPFNWNTMEFYNKSRKVTLLTFEEVYNELEASFIETGLTTAALHLRVGSKGKTASFPDLMSDD
ncbi:hypothetical protein DRE_01570 [Drechslerella stenobrocha 248]|uniref:Uncharacterized protein n=1 Tax=Drechslerella stenobrocha 248 TaxID=1043628 RepID=W7HV09_9PEZI|nr:hypothetical protein DRE_01570 [Drechslerella stenobrocha 248]